MAKARSQAKPAKHRNTLLTIALIVVILHGLFMFAVYWTSVPDVQRGPTSWALWVMLLSAAASVVAGIAMWAWKKWGIYLFGAAAVAEAVVGLLATGSLMMVFGALLPAIIVLYIIMMQRDKFE
jgi:hypothetical protein